MGIEELLSKISEITNTNYIINERLIDEYFGVLIIASEELLVSYSHLQDEIEELKKYKEENMKNITKEEQIYE